MRVRRVVGIGFAVFGLVVVSVILYLAFGDLGRHKARLESFITKHTGRAFAIDGSFELRLYPTITLLAERVRFANADWGSKPQMVEAGHLAAEVGFWSLISGPVDIRKVELSDVTVLLEKRRDGRGNWVLREPRADEEPQEPEEDAEPNDRTQMPLVIEKAKLTNVRVTYRAAGKPDLAARLETLTITPGNNGLLALDGSGKLDRYPISLKGDAGPVQALLTGHDIRMNVTGTLGRLALELKGGFGDLDPLDGVDLAVKASAEDVGSMLERLNLPVIATGALAIDAQLKDADERTRFDLDARVGDLAAKAHGSLKGLYLRDSDVTFEATAADAARLAGVFGIERVPAAPLTLSGRVAPTRREIRFTPLQAQLAGLSAKLDGTWKRTRRPAVALHFEVGVENLANVRAGLPQSPLSAQGDFAFDAEKLAVTGVTAALGENQFSGSFSTTRSEPRHIEADLSSPRFDLTPYFPQPPPGATPARPAAPAKASSASPSEPKREFLFSDAPLPIRELKGTEAKLHVAIAELTLAGKSLKDIESTVVVDRAHVEMQARATGSLEGTVAASISVEPVGVEGANLALKLGIENVRAGLDMKDMDRSEVPPLSVAVDLTTNGSSARQMAVNTNGYILLTQGAGKTKATFLNVFGGDVFSQLRTRLNPFRHQDPFTRLDCTVVRADIVKGAVTVQPVLMQTQKVTVAAKGKLDLHTEQLTFDFDTRPRKGIGVSPGMFTNPFIRLEGTLMSPRIAVGGKGMTSAGVAAATGGLSVVFGGFIDRLKGEANMCRRALDKANEVKAAAVSK